MKKSDKLKQERSQKRDRLHELQEAATKENRDYNEDENKEIKTLLGEIRSLDEKIETEEGLEEQMRQRAQRDRGSNTPDGISPKEDREIKNFSFLKVLRSAANREPLQGFEKEMQEEARSEMKSAGVTPSSSHFQIPMLVLNRAFNGKTEKRDMTATGGSGGDQGGVTVATDVDGYITALQNRTVMLRNGADMMTGLTGNIDMPRENAVFAPSWEGETDATAESSPTYEKVSFTPKRLAGYIDVSDQLLLQSSSSIEQRVRNQIILGHAIALDKAGLQGTGSNDQPTGIINDSDVTVVAIGANGGAITDALIVELEETVDLANGLEELARYYVTPKIRKVLKTTPLDSGSGLFLWDRLTNTVNSYNAVSTNQLPANLSKGSGTDLNAMVFGDLSSCAFGMWGGIQIKVDDLTQALSGITRMVLNSYNDFHVLQPGKLAAIKDVDPTA